MLIGPTKVCITRISGFIGPIILDADMGYVVMDPQSNLFIWITKSSVLYILQGV